MCRHPSSRFRFRFQDVSPSPCGLLPLLLAMTAFAEPSSHRDALIANLHESIEWRDSLVQNLQQRELLCLQAQASLDTALQVEQRRVESHQNSWAELRTLQDSTLNRLNRCQERLQVLPQPPRHFAWFWSGVAAGLGTGLALALLLL